MNPYENETELENSFHADVYHHMKDHGVSQAEAIKVITELDCYKKAFTNKQDKNTAKG
jgi:hypothetical protein